MRKWLVFLQFICIGSLLAGCSTVPITGRGQLSLLSSNEVATLAADNYHSVLKESKLSTDTQKTALLRQVGRRIQSAAETFLRENGQESELSTYAWEYNLIQDDKTVNAFCMPGGKVAFYTGILPVTKDETGLAVVMGHEVAHALANHGNERMSQQMLVELGSTVLSEALSKKPEQTKNIFLAAYGLGSQVGVLLPYSRAHENEADRIGMILMARAGYDPRATVAFWERMNALGGDRPPEFLSTHPAPAARVEQIQGYLEEALKYYRP